MSHPDIGWVDLSRGMGVPAVAVESCEGMITELRKALDGKGPHLIELQLKQG